MACASRVRPVGLRELDRVAAMWTAITEHHRAIDPFFHMRADAGDELMRFLGALYRDPDVAILVYEEPGPSKAPSDLSGLCIVRIDRAPPIMQEQERAEITDVGVREDARRRGIGRALVDAALDWVRATGVSRIEIQVAHANVEGQAFWRALGFLPLMDVLHRRLD